MAIYKAFTEKKEQISNPDAPIVLREEQKEAVLGAKKHFCTKKDGVYVPKTASRQYLWNAKMRFGKTFCALQLAKEMNVNRVLIVTHRPVVSDQWKEDFDKIYSDVKNVWGFGTKFDNDNEGDFYELEKSVRTHNHHYMFFASMQYLRRSTLVGGDNDGQLKKDILNNDWDLVVIDEAHEGTRTVLGQLVIERLNKDKTKLLHLSGTPFNLYSDFKDNEIFTWDYIQEQHAKKEWPEKHPNEHNPYEDLPEMKIFTYDLCKQFEYFKGEGANFTFSEFFRTWTGNPKADNKSSNGDYIGKQKNMPEGAKGRFVHEEDVKKFLDKLCEDSETSNYPFSKAKYQENFQHTLWVVPGVKEAKALENLLNEHEIFKAFNVINVAGNHVNDEEGENALDSVIKAIGEQPENTYTITISCGRLTTGVTVKPWTAVLYMKGSEMTSAATYMQTIFRVQSPAIINGMMKNECYVFDFSADRTLRMIAETAKYSSYARNKKNTKVNIDQTQEERDKEIIDQWISFCPICSLDGGEMKAFDVHEIFRQLERAYVNRLVLSGFNDNSLYDEEELLKMDPEMLRNLGEKIAQTTNMDKPKKISDRNFSMSHMTDEERRLLEEARRKANENKKKKKDPYDGLTEEEIEAIKAEKERKRKAREERDKRISNIRGIALRIPLMMYGGTEAGNPDESLTVDNFTRKIKDESWEEFMPRGVTKQDFNYVKKVFNATRFEEAGKRYRQLAREADFMHMEDRIERIAKIFACFHNPDKETVLTPWRVVNMHMSDTLGGYCFFNENFDGPNLKEIKDNEGKIVDYVTDIKPRFVDKGKVTKDIFKNSNAKVLEINSKTGLYPLYVTYSLYRNRFREYDYYGLFDERSVEEEQVVWDDIVKNNIYVICNTPMAASITRRTLFGFRDVNDDNIKAEKLVEKVIKSQDELVDNISRLGYWKCNRNKEKMKFNAVVGNPPYQQVVAKKDTNNGQKSVKNIFHHFQLIADKLGDYSSLIYPGARWIHQSGKGVSKFGYNQINDKKLSKLIYFIDAADVFENVDIVDGISIVLKDVKNSEKEFDYVFYKNGASYSIRMSHPGKELMPLDPRAKVIADKILKFVENKYSLLHDSVLSQKLFSIESDFVERNPNSVRTYSEGDFFDKTCEVKLLTNDKAGTAGRANWFIANRSEIKTGLEYLDKWKVIVSSAHAGGQKRSNQIEVIDNFSAFGRSRIALKTFDTREEANNFYKYVESEFIRFAFLLTEESLTSLAKLVPDIINYSNKNNLIDFSKDIDEQLYNLFNINNDEKVYIKDILRENR